MRCFAQTVNMATLRWVVVLSSAIACGGCGDERGAGKPASGVGAAGGAPVDARAMAPFSGDATCEDWANVKCERVIKCREPWAFQLGYGTREFCELHWADYCSEWLDHLAEPRPLEVFIACEEQRLVAGCSEDAEPFACPKLESVGPRPDGAPCAHPAECAGQCNRSNYYWGDWAPCGVCYTPTPYVPPTCTTAEDCPEGFLCLEDQTCGERSKGMPCEERWWCEPDARCIDGVCADPLALGDGCVDNKYGCEDGAVCYPDGVCEPYPIGIEDEPCGTGGPSLICAGHLYCGYYLTCVPWAEEGEPCTFLEPVTYNAGCQYEGTRGCQTCGPGLECENGVCVDPGPLVCPWP